MKHTFICPNCGKEFDYTLLQFSASATCPHCHKRYVVVKNKVMLFIEIAILIAMLVFFRTIIQSVGIQNYFIEIVLVVILLVSVNMVFDLFFTKVIKWEKYFTLLEKVIQSKE